MIRSVLRYEAHTIETLLGRRQPTPELIALVELLDGSTDHPGVNAVDADAIEHRLHNRFFAPYTGQFRYQIQERHPEPASKAVLAACDRLALLETLQPAPTRFRRALLFGGFLSQMLRSVESLAEFLAEPESHVSELIGVASLRSLEPVELWQLKQALGDTPIATSRPVTEADALRLLFDHATGVPRGPREVVSRGRQQLHEIAQQAQISIESDPHATTSQAVTDLLTTVAPDSFANEDLLVISAQPFTRYHLCVLLRALLRHGVIPHHIAALGAPVLPNSAGLALIGNHLAKLVFEERRLVEELRALRV